MKAEQKLKEKSEKAKECDKPEESKVAAKATGKEEDVTPNEYFRIRTAMVQKMKESGGDPYPHKYLVDTSLQDFIDKYSHLSTGQAEEAVTVSVAGNVFTRNTRNINWT